MAIKQGTPGPDTLTGTNGVDRLEGLAGDDRLFGLKGNDVLDGGLGSDHLDGGLGTDFATYASLKGPINVDASSTYGEWSVTAGGVEDTLTSIEGIVGTGAADYIQGHSGDGEVLRGAGGDDTIRGGIYSQAGDAIYGGSGNDELTGGEEILSADDARGGKGPGDSIHGEEGNDVLYGLDGEDRLDGGAGNDVLGGGPGEDLLTGGAGRDAFAYASTSTFIGYGTTVGDFGTDVITDFQKGQDRIYFSVNQTNEEDEPNNPLEGFKGLDSNRNGILDAGDTYVDIEKVKVDGVARLSTVIDAGDYSKDVDAPQVLEVYGVTGLKASDFMNDYPSMA